MKRVQAIIIGGGSAGLSAAVTLKKNGISDVLVIEKDEEPGGILEQCIHNGFGLQTFKEQLSGPAYAERFLRMAEEENVKILCNTTVTKLTPDKIVEYVNAEEGVVQVQAEAVILAVGCYERPRGGININGTRPAGVYTAGQAQRYLNIDGYLVGKRVFILGSGDIGLIMARRMTLEGAKVVGVAEIMPYSNGLPRNMKQCLEDFDIPLYLSHTVTKVFGKDRLEKIEVVEVDENKNPIAGSEQYFDVDTLLLSCGLIPENELSREMGVRMNPVTNGPQVNESLETSIPGVFAAGNVLHVHDLVDFVSEEAGAAGKAAAAYLASGDAVRHEIPVQFDGGVRYTVPSAIDPAFVRDSITIRFRVGGVMKNRVVRVLLNGKEVSKKRRQIMAPGEMEEVKLTRAQLDGCPGLNEIRICVEEV